MASAVDYVQGNSFIHQLNPLTKMCWTVAVMVVALTFSHTYFLLALLVSVLLVAVSAGVINRILPLVKGLSIFALVLVLLQVFFYKEGLTLFYLIPGGYVPVTTGALNLGIAMGIRMMALVLSFVVFLATTQFKDIVLCLTEKLKLPYDYVFMFMTALRFIPTFLSEVKQISAAQACRACTVDGGNPLVKIKSYIPVAVPLVLISLQKAERLAMAMETRGYGGGKRTYFNEKAIKAIDVFVMVLIAVMVICVIVARIHGYGVA